MVPGKAFEVTDEGASVGVIYTKHFVEEYHLPYKYRPPVENSVSEKDIRTTIESAIPEISDYQAGDPDLIGIIIAPKLKLNMSFSVRPRDNGFTLVMKNMMLKAGYDRKGPRDYVIKINPEYRITFERSIDQEIRVAVIEYIGQHVDEFEDGQYYTAGTDLMTFGMERMGNTFEIDFAGWNADMLYVPVIP
jgi:hypothetical protein